MPLILTRLAFLKRIPWWAFVAVVAVAAVWWLIVAHDRAQFNKGYNIAYEQGWHKQQIQQASIDTLTRALAQKNAETIARAQAYADSQKQDAANTKSNDAKQKADATRQATLQGIAQGAAMKPSCVAPTALLSALEGL